MRIYRPRSEEEPKPRRTRAARAPKPRTKVERVESESIRLTTSKANLLIRWANSLDCGPPINDLPENIRSGLLLCFLVQKLDPYIDLKGLNKKPLTRAACISNIEKALRTVLAHGARPKNVPQSWELYDTPSALRASKLLFEIFYIYTLRPVRNGAGKMLFNLNARVLQPCGICLLPTTLHGDKASLMYPPPPRLTLGKDFASGTHLIVLLHRICLERGLTPPELRHVYLAPQNKEELEQNLSVLFRLFDNLGISPLFDKDVFQDSLDADFLLYLIWKLYGVLPEKLKMSSSDFSAVFCDSDRFKDMLARASQREKEEELKRQQLLHHSLRKSVSITDEGEVILSDDVPVSRFRFDREEESGEMPTPVRLEMSPEAKKARETIRRFKERRALANVREADRKEMGEKLPVSPQLMEISAKMAEARRKREAKDRQRETAEKREELRKLEREKVKLLEQRNRMEEEKQMLIEDALAFEAYIVRKVPDEGDSKLEDVEEEEPEEVELDSALADVLREKRQVRWGEQRVRDKTAKNVYVLGLPDETDEVDEDDGDVQDVANLYLVLDEALDISIEVTCIHTIRIIKTKVGIYGYEEHFPVPRSQRPLRAPLILQFENEEEANEWGTALRALTSVVNG